MGRCTRLLVSALRTSDSVIDLDALHARGESVGMGSAPEVDDAIDPADTRHWIMQAPPVPGGPKPRDKSRSRGADNPARVRTRGELATGGAGSERS